MEKEPIPPALEELIAKLDWGVELGNITLEDKNAFLEAYLSGFLGRLATNKGEQDGPTEPKAKS